MYLVSGSAGFIGFSICLELLKKKKKVIGIDNLNDYYDIKLKKKRNKILKSFKNYFFHKINIINQSNVNKIFKTYKIDKVIHLAAQAGVRYSIKFPEKYIDTNIKGFFNIIEASKRHNIKHFLYASTSSVYGSLTNFPYKENSSASHPAQIYAATKRSNELIAHSYSSLYKLPTTGLRFFTVYGPWGRPDMALNQFVSNIKKNKTIEVFNYGNHYRDFTYIDDIVKITLSISNKTPKNNYKWNRNKPNTKSSYCPYRIINLGGNNPIKLTQFIKLIEKKLNKKAKIKYLPLQKGDMIKTQASSKWCEEITSTFPKIKPSYGISKFIDWHNNYYK